MMELTFQPILQCPEKVTVLSRMARETFADTFRHWTFPARKNLSKFRFRGESWAITDTLVATKAVRVALFVGIESVC